MEACNKPCKECPFIPNIKGWIGAYASVDNLHRTLMFHEEFPCHLTMGKKKERICKGSLIYMKKMGKMPMNPEIKRLMEELTPEEIALGMSYPELKKLHTL